MSGVTKAVVYIAIFFLVINAIPTCGAPNFRYTGSSLERSVVNIGFPMALAIYDSEVTPSLQTWPGTFLIPAAQLIAILTLVAAMKVIRRLS